MSRQCRTCGKKVSSDADVCAECASYGVWWDQVARRPAMEVTGTVTVPELVRLVEQDDRSVQVMLLPVEATGNRLLRYLGRGPDLLPEVVRVDQDESGVSVRFRDRYGTLGELWRPKRMPLRVLVDGQPIEVQ